MDYSLLIEKATNNSTFRYANEATRSQSHFF
jgi:hypothetical protein